MTSTLHFRERAGRLSLLVLALTACAGEVDFSEQPEWISLSPAPGEVFRDSLRRMSDSTWLVLWRTEPSGIHPIQSLTEVRCRPFPDERVTHSSRALGPPDALIPYEDSTWSPSSARARGATNTPPWALRLEATCRLLQEKFRLWDQRPVSGEVR